MPTQILRSVFFFLLFFFFCGTILTAEEANLAFNKTYTLSPRPTYSHCTDPEDTRNLTDGQSTESYFWTQKGTVGWTNVPFSVITVDLGNVESIGRVEFTTAAGVAGVEFPQAVYVQVSDDGKVFHEATELIRDELELNGTFPESYSIRCLHSKPMTTKGRYVRFLTLASGTFIFCDEIRIFAGSEPAETIHVTTPIAETPEKTYKIMQSRLCLSRRCQADADAILQIIEASDLSAQTKEILSKRVQNSRIQMDQAFDSLPTEFQAILPLESNHAEMYRTLAAFWKAKGCDDVTLEIAQIWDPLNRFVIPKNTQNPKISVTAMQNETRCAAFNLYNATEETQSVTLTLSGIQAAANVTVRRVQWTDTNICKPVACALPEITPNKDGTYTIPVLPGLVQQVWFEFHTNSETKFSSIQNFHGNIQYSWCDAEIIRTVPVELTVYPFVFPQKTTLELGGWDYTDAAPAYNVNAQNLPSFLQYVQSRHVNAPWGRAGLLLANCRRNPADGSITLDTTQFDAWIENWKPEEVQEYFIFLALGGWSSDTNATFLSTRVGSEEFRVAVKNWLEAWKKHWASRGISADRINLLLHDEPNETTKNLTVLLAWMKAIHEACPEVKIWEDPCYKNLEKAPREFFEACDVLCPNRPAWLMDEKAFDAFYARQREEGRTLNLYSCSGPQRLLDPYAYCLLQAWEAARIGAKASFFWALGDGGGVTSWNEYYLGRNSYCPLFIDPNDSEVVPGKHMEAIAASAQDFEYIHLLRTKIETLRSSDPNRAEKLENELTTLILDVLNASSESNPNSEPKSEAANAPKSRANLEWNVTRDRNAADRARIRILDLLLEP